MTRVDPVTADKVRQVLQSARARGADAAVALDQAGLLSYPGKERDAQIDFLGLLSQSLEQIPVDILGIKSVPRTPLDLKRWVISYIDGIRDGLIRNGDTKE